ncbi:MAG: sensor domain-containing diguanylate cyclase [Alphaproteobacteria bacterium]|nr:sensor domain-containing diguanylate cyclase [Alphaproteobacteria bacterium]
MTRPEPSKSEAAPIRPDSRAAYARLCALYPGPCFRWRGGETVTAANEAAEPLTIEQDGMAALAALCEEASAEGAGKTATIAIATLSARFEATALPLSVGDVLVLCRDRTLDSQINQAMSQSRGLYKDLADLAGDFVWETDADGRFSFISAQGALGRPAVDWIGQRPETFYAQPALAPRRSPFSPRQALRDVEIWMTGRDGAERCLLISGLPVLSPDGAYLGARGLAVDVTEERRSQAALAAALSREDLARHIVNLVRGQDTPEAMLETAARTICRAASAAGCDIFTAETGGWRIAARFGAGPDTAEAQDAVADLASKDGDGSRDVSPAVGVVTLYRDHGNGAILLWPDKTAGAAWRDEAAALLAVVEGPLGLALRQIADQQALVAMARTDELTRLLNRRAFMAELATALDRAKRHKAPGALLYIDLDNFKPINDTHGHEAGDRALMAIAEVLRGHSRRYDLAARLGGDEFALWLDETDGDTAESRAWELRDAVRALDVESGAPDKPFGLSIGVAVHGMHDREGFELKDLLNQADAAMYRAKKAGKNSVYVARDPSVEAAP